MNEDVLQNGRKVDELWRGVIHGVRAGTVEQSLHWIPEERRRPRDVSNAPPPCVVLEWVMSMLKPLLLSIKIIKRREGEPSNNCHCYWFNLSMSIFKLYHKIKLIQGWNEVQSVINAVMLLLIKYDLIGALWTHTHTRKLIYLFSLVTWHWNNEKEALCSWISVHQLPSCCHFSLHQRVLKKSKWHLPSCPNISQHLKTPLGLLKSHIRLNCKPTTRSHWLCCQKNEVKLKYTSATYTLNPV